MRHLRHAAFYLMLAIFLMVAVTARADRVKDLADIGGVRDNPLVGYGLVVGLSGTGDQTSQAPFTIQSIRNMLSRFGVRVPDEVNPQLKNVAAVVIHASLPAFAKPGQAIDITVSSIGNAQSLRGGSLLMAPLLGADNQVYAMAQGSLLVGGLGVSGQDGSKVVINVPSSGRIPGGAMVERAAPSALAADGSIMLNLKTADFATANRLAERINGQFGGGVASAVDAASVRVAGPVDVGQRVGFIGLIQDLEVQQSEPPARVVINARTGTLVIGGHVRALPAAVTHGSLTVTISEKPEVSQPAPFSKGQTVVVPRSEITVEQPPSRMFKLDTGVTLDELVKSINAVGASPADLVAILEALKQAGSLRAELIVI